jgi:hypothetical protein
LKGACMLLTPIQKKHPFNATQVYQYALVYSK